MILKKITLPKDNNSKNYFGAQQNNFSYSQLETYKRCPLQYKYQYILKIPSPPTAALSFGDTMHRTLQDFYQIFIENKSVNLRQLFTLYEKNWTPVGYVSPAHEKRMKSEGRKILTDFYKKYHSKNLKILALEKLFKIKLRSDINITGKIDRIDADESDMMEIIDYKTGKKPSDRDLKKSLQLSIYALAATDRGLYNKKLSDVKLTFYYLQTPDKISFQKNSEEITETKNQIIEIVDKIRSNDYTPTPGLWCDFCPFKIVCEAWQ